MHSRQLQQSLASVALLAAVIPSVRADDGHGSGIPEPSIASSLPANGDPSGLRGALAERGVAVEFHYAGDVNSNSSGGIKQSTHYSGLAELVGDVDLETAAGLAGLSFHVSSYQIHGTSITAENISGIAAVSNLEAFPSTRLFEMWLEQSLLDDKLSIRFGQVAVDAEFFASEVGGNFFNSTFGWTTISSDNLPIGGPIYPMATPGARVAFDPNENLKLMAGIWNGDPVGPCPDELDPGQCNTNGLDFRIKDPPLMFVEAGYSYNQDGSLPGTIKLGGWRHFGDVADQRFDTTGGPIAVTGGDPLQHRGNHGLYAVVDQMIYNISGDGARNVTVFGRIAASPSDRNQIDFYADGGIAITGMFESRPGDVFGVALAYSGLSSAAADFDRDSGLSVIRDHETVLEISYAAEVLPGLTVQPDFQYYWNPGGNVEDPNRPGEAVRDAAIFGMRTVVNY